MIDPLTADTAAAVKRVLHRERIDLAQVTMPWNPGTRVGGGTFGPAQTQFIEVRAASGAE